MIFNKYLKKKLKKKIKKKPIIKGIGGSKLLKDFPKILNLSKKVFSFLIELKYLISLNSINFNSLFKFSLMMIFSLQNNLKI
jgi:hypothetical protein